MSRRIVIADPLKFAVDGASLSGTVPVAELSRLASMVVDTVGTVSYELIGESGLGRSPSLRFKATVVLQLCCQRCLGALEWALDRESVLQLVRPGTPIPDEELENDEVDVIEATPDMDVLALVEDELLLAVPLAPRHDSCDPPRPLGGADKESPFAALAKLRKDSRAH